jgi:hypothetical protein
MAYVRTNLKLTDQAIDGMGKEWVYTTDDAIGTVAGSGYFSDGYTLGMRLGDRVFVIVCTAPADPTAVSAGGYRVISSVNASTGAATAGVSLT